MKKQSRARTTQVTRIINRRPPRMRSRSGLSRGAITANGAIVMSRYRSTFGRDWPGDTEKNSDPASETATQTSAQTLAPCVRARRANGVGSANRESVGSAGLLADGGGVPMPGPTLSVTFAPFRDAEE